MVYFTFSLQYKAECLGWSGSLPLQIEAALIGEYGKEQIDYRYVLYMTPTSKNMNYPFKVGKRSAAGLNLVSAGELNSPDDLTPPPSSSSTHLQDKQSVHEGSQTVNDERFQSTR